MWVFLVDKRGRLLRIEAEGPKTEKKLREPPTGDSLMCGAGFESHRIRIRAQRGSLFQPDLYRGTWQRHGLSNQV